MKNIDTTRLLNLLRWDLVTYKKTYRNMFLAPCGMILISALLLSNYLFSWGDGWNINHFTATELTIPAIMIVTCGMAGVMGHAFGHLTTTQDRITYFMLPASNIEKYLVRVVLRGTIMFAELILAIVAADVIFGLLSWLRTGEYSSCIAMSQFFDNVLGTGHTSLREWFTTALFVIQIWSVFLVGSAFFRRRPVLMTFLVWTGATLVFSAVLGISIGYMIEWFRDISSNLTITVEWIVDPIILLNSIVIVCQLLWISFFVWWSYRIFTHMQVINNRWNNLKK